MPKSHQPVLRRIRARLRGWLAPAGTDALADEGQSTLARLGLLGIVGGTAGVGMLATGVASTEAGTTALALSAVAIAGASWQRVSMDVRRPFQATVLAWFAGLGSIAVEHPFVAGAGFLLVGACALSGHDGKPQEITVEKADDFVAAPEQVPQEDGAVAYVDQSGVITANGSEALSSFRKGASLVSLTHLADRVGLLRSLSHLRAGTSETELVSARINVGGSGEHHRYVPMHFQLSKLGGGIVVHACENAGQESINDEKVLADQRFLAIVSHELRTPLNAIIGFSDVLRAGIAGPLHDEKQRDYVDMIHGAGSHLLSLVNTILDVSKIESGTYNIHRESFDFPATARECIAMVEASANEKSIHINQWLGGVNCEANADRRAIKQILLNLLSNAVKYTAEGGCVTLDAKTGADGLVITVSDTGIGIERDDLDRLGKPFAQVENAYTRNCEGTGLGLAMVKGLVGLHGGTMNITSDPGVGTQVTIVIPSDPAGDRVGDDADEIFKTGNNIVSHDERRKAAGAKLMAKEMAYGARRAG